MSKNQDYPIYVLWIDTLDWILACLDRYPRSVRYSVSSRIANYSLEVLDLIVEAIYTRERKALLTGINLRLEKLRVFFHLSLKRRYISQGQYQYVSQAINSAGAMVGGWSKSAQ